MIFFNVIYLYTFILQCVLLHINLINYDIQSLKKMIIFILLFFQLIKQWYCLALTNLTSYYKETISISSILL